jgi:transposase
MSNSEPSLEAKVMAFVMFGYTSKQIAKFVKVSVKEIELIIAKLETEGLSANE